MPSARAPRPAWKEVLSLADRLTSLLPALRKDLGTALLAELEGRLDADRSYCFSVPVASRGERDELHTLSHNRSFLLSNPAQVQVDLCGSGPAIL